MLPPPSSFQARLAKLGYERGAMEARYPEVSDAWFHIYTMPGGGGGGIAYYPAGVGTRRYVLNLSSFAFQHIRRGRTVDEWVLKLETRKEGSKPPPQGTLRRELWDCRLQPPARLTKAQIVALDTVKAFASYSQYAYDDAYADYLNVVFTYADGRFTKGILYYPDPIHFRGKRAYAPISGEEAVFLRLGHKTWTGPKRLKTIPTPAYVTP